jgi:multiple sugar transport system permease protein
VTVGSLRGSARLAQPRTSSRALSASVQEALIGYAFVAPVVLIFGVFYAYAIARSLALSFTNFKFLSPSSQFVGLDNYVTALQDHWVLEGFAKAAYFTVLSFLGSLLLPLLVALVLDRVSHPRLSSIYRVLLFLPAIMPAPLIARLWRWMYLPSFGLINYVLVDWLHILDSGPLWLVSPELAMPSLAFMAWWSALGIVTIFLLAGLDGIPKELYEAARIDGASELRIVWSITLPLLRNTLIVWSILRIETLAVVEPILAMWGGGGGSAPYSIWTWAYYAWETGFKSGRMPFGYASAIGWIGAGVMIALALVVRWLFRERDRATEGGAAV